MRVAWTGFGQFQGVEANPSAVLAQRLAAQHSTEGDSVEILEVSAAAAKAWRCPDAGLVVHLGVAITYDAITLERCAYNDASFRVPDFIVGTAHALVVGCEAACALPQRVLPPAWGFWSPAEADLPITRHSYSYLNKQARISRHLPPSPTFSCLLSLHPSRVYRPSFVSSRTEHVRSSPRRV